jgi:hypothetical protein
MVAYRLYISGAWAAHSTLSRFNLYGRGSLTDNRRRPETLRQG